MTVWACNVAVTQIRCNFILINLHTDKKGLAWRERRKRRAVPFWASSPCGFEDGTCVNWMKWRWMIYCELNPLLYKDGDTSDGPHLLFSCRPHTHTHTPTHILVPLLWDFIEPHCPGRAAQKLCNAQLLSPAHHWTWPLEIYSVCKLCVFVCVLVYIYKSSTNVKEWSCITTVNRGDGFVYY